MKCEDHEEIYHKTYFLKDIKEKYFAPLQEKYLNKKNSQHKYVKRWLDITENLLLELIKFPYDTYTGHDMLSKKQLTMLNRINKWISRSAINLTYTIPIKIALLWNTTHTDMIIWWTSYVVWKIFFVLSNIWPYKKHHEQSQHIDHKNNTEEINN